MKKIILILISIPILMSFRTGEEFDEKRMKRDLEIAKNVLSTLIKSDSEHFFGRGSIEANYIKDYGVIFTIPQQMMIIGGGPNTIISIPEFDIPDIHMDFDLDIDDENDIDVDDKRIIIEQRKKSIAETKEKLEKDKVKIKEKSRYRYQYGAENDIEWEEVMTTFLTDYADLIGQLKPDERIVIRQKNPYNNSVFVWSDDNKTETHESSDRISAEVLRKDLSAYKAGKIKKEELEKRIAIKKVEPQKKVQDLEMFATILNRYYSHDLSETYHSQGKPRYDVIEGHGAIFNIRLSAHNSRHFSENTNTSGWITGDEEYNNEEAAKMHANFKEEIRMFLLDYGRTIRSLDDDEKVILAIRILGCGSCDFSKNMEISAKISVLRQYDQQKISKEEAMGSIQIKES